MIGHVQRMKDDRLVKHDFGKKDLKAEILKGAP